jgi:hypothetical protein
MLAEFPDHLALRDGRDDAQRPLLAKRAARHGQGNHPFEEPRSAPAWRPCVGFVVHHPWLAGCGDDGAAQVAVRRQTAAVAHQMHEYRKFKRPFPLAAYVHPVPRSLATLPPVHQPDRCAGSQQTAGTAVRTARVEQQAACREQAA